MRLDSIDLRILAELQADARISVAELSRRVALTPTPCARRVRQLERAGVIRAYVAMLDQGQLELSVTAFAEIRLVRESRAEVAAFESAIRSYPEVVQAWAMSGAFDYLLRVVTPDLDGYNRFLRERLLNLASVDHVQTGFALQRVVDRSALPLEHLALRRAR